MGGQLYIDNWRPEWSSGARVPALLGSTQARLRLISCSQFAQEWTGGQDQTSVTCTNAGCTGGGRANGGKTAIPSHCPTQLGAERTSERSELHVGIQSEQQNVSCFSFRSFIKSKSWAIPSVWYCNMKSHIHTKETPQNWEPFNSTEP